MDDIKWHDLYLVGVAVLDDEHKELFYRLENYRSALENQQPHFQALRLLFDHVQHYVHIHLAHEERILLQIKHPGAQERINAHRIFSAEVHRLKQLYYDLPSLFPHADTLEFLNAWLVNQIQTLDPAYVTYLTSHPLVDPLTAEIRANSQENQSPGNRPYLVVLDDEKSIGHIVCATAENLGFEAHAFQDESLFLSHYSEHIDVIVLDIQMPKMDGIEVIRTLAERGCQASLILISGFDPSVLHSAQELARDQSLQLKGALTKPFRINSLNQLLLPLVEKQVHTPRSIQRSNKPFRAAEINAALLGQQFVPYYQPQVALSDKTVVGVEVLCRWQHPGKGLIQPAQFIPLAEKYNLIAPMTWALLAEALAQTQQLRRQHPGLQLAINMSACMFSALDLPEKMSALLAQYDMPPAALVIEVTESIIMDEAVKALDSLTRLRLKGFNISIDDFGTGYSSMQLLHRIPFSEIKIDQSFIMKMQHDAEAQAIAETVIMLGHKLGLTVVAEGIEDKITLAQLKELNCEVGQGFHFAQPMPAEEFFQWLEQHKVRPYTSPLLMEMANDG